MRYYLIAVAIIAFDRFVKYLVSSQMMVGETIPLLENIFHITYIHNRGAAFSLMEGELLFLTVLPLLAITTGFILLYVKRKSWNVMFKTAVAFICGGGAGNLIDRMYQGYVVDMFDFRVFPIFNIADIFICVGCGLLLLDVIISERKNKKDAAK